MLLDLGDIPGKDVRRIISSWWYRFRRTVENTPTALVVVAADSCVRSCASLALEMSKETDLWSSPGYESRTKVFPLRTPPETTHANLLKGIRGPISIGTGPFTQVIDPPASRPPHGTLEYSPRTPLTVFGNVR